MGNSPRKTGEVPDEMTGLTEHQKELVQATWRSFTSHNREYGALIFLSLFVKHPEYLRMFRNFRGKSVAQLKDDPIFRAHGCSIGYHVTSMVESLGDPASLEVLVRRNATEHLRRKGVKPHHFEVMGQCLMDVLRAREERVMTPEAIEGWGKFLTLMVRIIKDVFEKAAAERAERGSVASSASGIDDTGFTSPYQSAEITSGSRRTGEGSVSTMTAGSPRRPPSHKIGAGRKIGASKKGSVSQPAKLEDETPMLTPPAEVSPDNKHHDKP
ncbi:globin-like [Dermacentor andersoni]|uniref:globin-like n=1 Tax=Dermacentor andersoni TaxID=34620 RepID=UPI002417A615|nr:globin-like [Dermacentor andersoni]